MEAKKAQWCQVNSHNDSYGIISVDEISVFSSLAMCHQIQTMNH